MKRPVAKKKKKSVSSKNSKRPAKALRKILKKIRTLSKKTPIRPRISKKPALDQLILKESFARPGTKAAMSPVEAQPVPSLPAYYEENKLVLMVRDPWWLFAYWEVTPWREAEVTAEIGRQGLLREKTVLRVYEAGASFFDIEIDYLNSHWYIDVGRPDREWLAEIGIRTRDGKFFMLVRSNAVKTPPFGLSEVLDEEWMMPDEMYFKLLGILGGFDSPGDSMQMRRLIEKYIRQSAFSESASQLSRAKPVS